MTRATRQKEKEEEQAGRRATKRLSQQTDREGGGGSKVPSAEREGSARGGNHGDSPRAEHATTQESEAEASQHGLTLLQPTVVEVSAAVVDNAKAGEHCIADVGGSPPSGGRGRRRQRKSDGEEEYDTAVPGDINTRPKRRQTSRGADDAGGVQWMQLTKGAGRASVTPLSTGAPRFYTPYSGPSKVAARAPGAPRGEESESPPPGHATHSPLASPSYPYRQLHASPVWGRAVSPLAGPSRGQGPSTSANPFPELPFSRQRDSVRAHRTAAEDVDTLGQKGDSSHPFPPLLGALGESAEHEQFVTREEFQALWSEMYAMFAQLGLRRGAPASYAGGSAVVPMKGTPLLMSAVEKARVLVL
ncbi:unnamed protein product [Closterium sp. NIES-54]